MSQALPAQHYQVFVFAFRHLRSPSKQKITTMTSPQPHFSAQPSTHQAYHILSGDTDTTESVYHTADFSKAIHSNPTETPTVEKRQSGQASVDVRSDWTSSIYDTPPDNHKPCLPQSDDTRSDWTSSIYNHSSFWRDGTTPNFSDGQASIRSPSSPVTHSLFPPPPPLHLQPPSPSPKKPDPSRSASSPSATCHPPPMQPSPAPDTYMASFSPGMLDLSTTGHLASGRDAHDVPEPELLNGTAETPMISDMHDSYNSPMSLRRRMTAPLREVVTRVVRTMSWRPWRRPWYQRGGYELYVPDDEREEVGEDRARGRGLARGGRTETEVRGEMSRETTDGTRRHKWVLPWWRGSMTRGDVGQG